MKKRKLYLIGIICVALGVLLVLCPFFMKKLSEKQETNAISQYQKIIDTLVKEGASEAELEDPLGNGIVGYITIEKIGQTLPIYNTTDTSNLTKGVGVMDQTSLPFGVAGTHSVLVGHRGLPSAELFRHLDRLEIGENFEIHTLGKVYKYEIYDIITVEPEDYTWLNTDENETIVSLYTCTPYAENTHRLIVLGRLVDE